MAFFYYTPLFKKYVKKARNLLQRWQREKKKYLIYGAGVHSKELFNQIDLKSPFFLGFIDQSRSVQKKGFKGFPVFPIEEAVKMDAGGILVSSYEFQDRMKLRILELKGNKIEIGNLYPTISQKNSFNKIFYKPALKSRKKLLKPKGRKVAVVDTFFSWPPIGGSSVDIAYIMNWLSKNGFDVTFFLPVIEDDLYFPRGRIGSSKGIDFNVVNICYDSHSFNLKCFIEKISQAVKDFGPEFVFLGDIYAFKPYLAEKLKDYKTIWRSYAYDIICPRCNLLDNKGRICSTSYLSDPERCKQCINKDSSINWEHPIYREMKMARVFSKKYYALLIKNIERAHHIIVYNDILKKRIRACFPSFRRIKAISSGIETKEFSKKKQRKDKKLTILFPGRIDDPAKGFEFFLKVFHRIKEEHAHVRLLITGKIDFGEDGIESIGWVPYSQMPDIYHRADICVIPSLWEEPFGIAALEAMASRIPVVASSVGGLKRIIQHKETGFLISPGNKDKFYGSLKQLVSNEDLRKKMGEKGKARAEEYSWNKIMRKYQTVFR